MYMYKRTYSTDHRYMALQLICWKGIVLVIDIETVGMYTSGH